MKKLIIMLVLILSWLITSAQGDLCSNATVLTINGTCSPVASNIVAANTASGTTPLPSCGGNWKDIWYKFTGTGGQVAIKYTPAAGDAVIAVYTGSCGSLTQIDCGDLNGSGLSEVSIIENTSTSTTYYVRIMRFGSGSGTMNGTICAWGGTETTGNNCSTAPLITTSFNQIYSTNLSAPLGQASYDPSTTQFTCNGSIDNLTYFKFTTNGSGGNVTATIDELSCWANVGIQVALFKPTTPCLSPAAWGTAVFCNVVAANTTTTTLNWTGLLPNTTYYLIIDGNGGDICAWRLSFSGALPIELVKFTGEPYGEFNLLKWLTATETNNNYFLLERSNDAVNFDEVGTLDGAGNSTSYINYSMLDKKPYNGITYYRLKQVDYDGKSTTSQIIAVSREENIKDLKVIRVTNIIGQEVTDEYDGVKIYYFNNGTVLKKYEMKER